MSRLFGYTAAAADRDTASIEAFEIKKIEAKANYRLVHKYIYIFRQYECIMSFSLLVLVIWL